MNPDKSKTSKRKKEHLELCLTDDVNKMFLEKYYLILNLEVFNAYNKIR